MAAYATHSQWTNWTQHEHDTLVGAIKKFFKPQGASSPTPGSVRDAIGYAAKHGATQRVFQSIRDRSRVG